jgi:hypothetical protein
MEFDLDFLIKSIYRWYFAVPGVIWSLVNFGFILPWTISAKSSIIVIGGFAYAIIVAVPVLFGTFHIIMRIFKNFIKDLR